MQAFKVVINRLLIIGGVSIVKQMCVSQPAARQVLSQNPFRGIVYHWVEIWFNDLLETFTV